METFKIISNKPYLVKKIKEDQYFFFRLMHKQWLLKTRPMEFQVETLSMGIMLPDGVDP